MARPIEKTPVMQGLDAKRFRESLFASFKPLPVSERNKKKKELLEMEKSYKIVVAASDGVFY